MDCKQIQEDETSLRLQTSFKLTQDNATDGNDNGAVSAVVDDDVDVGDE